jgi:TonB family protein
MKSLLFTFITFGACFAAWPDVSAQNHPLPEASQDAACLGITFSVQLRSTPVLRVNSPIPRPINQPLPDYPIGMRIQGVSGDVKLRLKIAPDGTVESITVVSADYPAFESVAREAVSNWKFSETLENRGRVPVEVDYTFEFRMLFDTDEEKATRPYSNQIKPANQALLPTTMTVTPPAGQESRRP